MLNTILIVEDESIVAMELKDRLQTLGYHITDICATGEQAVTVAGELHPDLILMDIIIKGKLDGIETAAAIRKVRDIPILFLTAHSDQKTLERAMNESPYGYILKPFKKKELQISIDIALQRHRDEIKIRKNEAWLQAILRSIEDGVITTDKNGIITFVNHTAALYTGIPEQKAMGRNFSSIVKLITRTRVPIKTGIKQIATLELSAHQLHQAVLVSSDNTEYEIEGSTAPIRNKQEGFEGIVFVFHDITENNRLKKVESLSFIAGEIAHNFNNLLTGILGNVSLAKLYTSPAAKGYPFLENAEGILNKTQDLSQKLLTFSRGERPAAVILDAAAVIKETALKIVQGTRIKLDFISDTNLWLITFNKKQLICVIENIIKNAVQTLQGEGHISVLCRNSRKEKKYVHITISDNGKGIKPEFLHNIFDPFFTTEEEKIGIGLSTAYFILKNYHAHISVDSREKQGTTVKLLLPASPSKSTTESTPA